MATRSPEERHAVAARVAELATQVDRLLRGERTRAEVEAWAGTLARAHAGYPFPGNPWAGSLFACLHHLHAPIDGEPLVRDHDLRVQLDDLRQGAPTYALLLAALRAEARTIGDLLGVVETREWIDGLGWYEEVRFASPATGRAFCALGPRHHDPPWTELRTVEPTTAPADALADVLDTLRLDLDDVTPAFAVELPRWRLVRTDDNGQTATVATYSALGKARAALAAYEARGHKQLYALEPL